MSIRYGNTRSLFGRVLNGLSMEITDERVREAKTSAVLMLEPE